MPDAFHFQHPEWFWLLLPLLLVWLGVRRPAFRDTPWRRVCDARLLPYLLVNGEGRNRRLPAWLLGCAWLLTVIALADPVWERLPQPVYRSQDARVVVLDLSRSMLAPDLPPSRLERARYKVADILERNPDGQTGLVVFAGDAFTVAPLSNDTDTIRSLLQPLEPALMPVQGSRVERALEQAAELLRQAGPGRGTILLVGDGYAGEGALAVARRLHAQGFRLDVLGVGTAAGAPLPDGQGGYVRDAQGEIVMPRLDVGALQELAVAGGGRYATISATDRDLRHLLDDPATMPGSAAQERGLTASTWQSRGPWLVLLLLPLAALVFRRGWLLLVVLTVAHAGMPRPAMALGWDDLWLRADQQAMRALDSGTPAAAADLATDPRLQGTAAYQAGDYPRALDAFVRSGGPDSDYNRGNTLARMGRYEEAIAAYDRALEAQPGMEDAAFNKAQVEQLLREQERQRSQQEQQQDGQQQDGQQQDGQQQDGQQQDGQQQDGQPQDGQPQDGHAGEQQQDAQSGEADAVDPAAQQTGAAPSVQPGDTGSDTDRPRDEAAAAQPGDGAEPQPGDDASEAARPEDTAGASAPAEPAAGKATANPLDSEERQAAEQWLRRIPDDPGGLLRRKFLYQYRQRAAGAGTPREPAW